jgi:methionyl-tRNA formyltransferase
MRNLRIIFMGTPEFAVPSLQILVENNFNVVAVVTAPDKPKGRGLQVSTSPVKDYAVTKNIPVLQPSNLKSSVFLEELRSYEANLQVVVAFRMLPEVVWNMPAHGTFNLHASLLPQYRGAAPINWAIINGEPETGITTFFLQHEIDTGSIIYQEKEDIKDDDDAGKLYERLMHKGAQLVLKTVIDIQKGEYPNIPQPRDKEFKHAPKIFKETCEINWGLNSRNVYNFIRGLSPYPCAWTNVISNKTSKIFKVKPTEISAQDVKPGTVISDNKSFIQISTADYFVDVVELQMEGKKRMGVEEFLRGNRIL